MPPPERPDRGASAMPTGLSQAEPQEGLGPPGFDPSRIWANDLTDAQLSMVMESSGAAGDVLGYGVELRGAGWATARSLARKGLGSIDGDPGAELSGLYFNNAEGVRIAHEFDEDEEEGWGCPLCGLHREHSHDM